MNLMKSQNGITLIEVLATLTILSILLGSIYSVFFNGLRYSSQAEDTVLIQQEANYVLTMLKEQYQHPSGSYIISVSTNGHEITIGDKVIESTKYKYEIIKTDNNPDNNQSATVTTPISIDPTNSLDPLNKKFPVQIIIVDENNKKYEIKTILSRL